MMIKYDDYYKKFTSNGEYEFDMSPNSVHTFSNHLLEIAKAYWNESPYNNPILTERLNEFRKDINVNGRDSSNKIKIRLGFSMALEAGHFVFPKVVVCGNSSKICTKFFKCIYHLF